MPISFVGRDKLLDRFWSKVKIGRPEDCWEWQASKLEHGYGKFWMFGREYKAHRVAWSIENGSIPDGLLVLHKCDNPKCVNPDHLFLGTNKDNTQDMIRKGRYAGGERHSSRTHPECRPRGEKNWQAKLTEKDVIAIRNLYDIGNITQRELGKLYGVSQEVIFDVIHHNTWKHI